MTTTSTTGDELLFHFRELVKEKQQAGLSFDGAWDAADEQFGSLRQYQEACQAVQLRAQMFPRRAIVAGVVAMVLGIGWLALEVHSVGQGQGALLAQTLADQPVLHDLTGRVLDRDDKPLANARVLLILKTWPNDRYRQQDSRTTTDEEGRYTFAKRIPETGQYAVLVTAFKDNFAFQSKYELVQEPAGKPGEIDLRLEPSTPVALQVRDPSGQPLAAAEVIPSQRTSKSGETQLIYFQGSEILRVAADREGRVQLHGFQAGDSAEIYVRSPGGEWEEKTFQVPEKGVVEIAHAAVPSDWPEVHDLAGRVLDDAGQPLANARVLVILKTWPNGRYRQQDFTTQTDAEGRYTFAKLIPGRRRYAVLVTALAEGRAFQSKYELIEQPTGRRDAVDLNLPPATPVTLVVRDAGGRALQGAGVVPTARQAPAGESQLIYFQGSQVLRVETDEAGRVVLHGFQAGDEGAIHVQPPGGEWVRKEFHVPVDGTAVEIAL